MRILIVCISVLLFTTTKAQQPGKVVDSIICKTDASQSYAVYIPAKSNKNVLPVIYFFDPHGSGALPLHRYKALAEIYGFILVGSNNSKNGNDLSTTERIWSRLFADTKSRLNIDAARIYTAGFSGGAKAASFFAIQHPEIKGVIVGGAGLPDGVEADNFPFCITTIAGEGDMNLTELVGMNNGLDRTKTRHHLLFFEGKHEWAPATTMDIAFTGLQLDAMEKSLIPKEQGFIDQYVTKSRNRVGGYSASNQLIRADQECKLSISLLDGLDKSADWFRAKSAAISSNPVYKKQQQNQQELLRREERTKLDYMQHFQQIDLRFWTTVIDELQKKSKIKNAETGMNQRLLAYLSLAFYSLSNRLIIGNDNANARRFVDLYKLADPTNSEAWYFSAILDMRNRQPQLAENDLIRAAQCGFVDRSRLQQQREFQRLDLQKIESQMKTKE